LRQLVERLDDPRRGLPVGCRRALEQRHVPLREHCAPACKAGVDRVALEAFAEEKVPEALRRGLTGPVLGAREALLGQFVAPDLADALDERVGIEPVGREEQRAVDVEEEKR
jgi:hypothetical protein